MSPSRVTVIKERVKRGELPEEALEAARAKKARQMMRYRRRKGIERKVRKGEIVPPTGKREWNKALSETIKFWLEECPDDLNTIARQIILAAKKGEEWAVRMLWERLEGKMTEKTQVEVKEKVTFLLQPAGPGVRLPDLPGIKVLEEGKGVIDVVGVELK